MKNLDIYINGVLAVHDEKTLVGSILWNFDFTDPANRKQPYTNSLRLPVMENQHIFEFASEPGYNGSIPYDRVSVEIIVDGYYLLKDGIGYISSVKDGYYIISVREQPDIIQKMKDRSLGFNGITGPLTSPIVQTLLNNTNGGKLDFIMNEQTRLDSIANPTQFKLFRTNANYTFYVHTIFSSVATFDGITFAGSLMTDPYFLNMRMIVYQSGIHARLGGSPIFLDDIRPNTERSFFDLFKAILQIFGAVYTIDGSTVTIDRLDDLTLGQVDWSGKLNKVVNKKFNIPNLAQNNYLRYQTGGDAEEGLNESVWTSNNKNVEHEGNIIEPKSTVFPFIDINNIITGLTALTKCIYIPDSDYSIITSVAGTTQTTVNGINEFVFLVDGTDNMPVGTNVVVEYTNQNSPTVATASHALVAGDNRAIATYYNSQNDYQRFAAMLADPVMYEVEMNLNVLDLHDYSPFNLALVPELAGEFYINKLQYNFEKEGRASKVQLIKYVEP